ncbi:unnamed protein product [Effrenium voratum]|nr:unnamed protein product [Effrenium voratum]
MEERSPVPAAPAEGAAKALAAPAAPEVAEEAPEGPEPLDVSSDSLEAVPGISDSDLEDPPKKDQSRDQPQIAQEYGANRTEGADKQLPDAEVGKDKYLEESFSEKASQNSSDWSSDSSKRKASKIGEDGASEAAKREDGPERDVNKDLPDQQDEAGDSSDSDDLGDSDSSKSKKSQELPGETKEDKKSQELLGEAKVDKQSQEFIGEAKEDTPDRIPSAHLPEREVGDAKGEPEATAQGDKEVEEKEKKEEEMEKKEEEKEKKEEEPQPVLAAPPDVPKSKEAPLPLLSRLRQRLLRLFGRAKPEAPPEAPKAEPKAEPKVTKAEPAPKAKAVAKAVEEDLEIMHQNLRTYWDEQERLSKASVRLSGHIIGDDAAAVWPGPKCKLHSFAKAVAAASMCNCEDVAFARKVEIDIKSGHLFCIVRILDASSARAVAASLVQRLHEVTQALWPLQAEDNLNVAIMWPFELLMDGLMVEGDAWHLETILSPLLDEAWHAQEAVWRAVVEQVPRDAQELCGLPSLRRYEGALLPMALGRKEERLPEICRSFPEEEWPVPLADLYQQAEDHHRRAKEFLAPGSEWASARVAPGWQRQEHLWWTAPGDADVIGAGADHFDAGLRSKALIQEHMQLPVGLAVAGRWWALGIAADAAFAAAALPAEEFSAQQAAQHAVDHHWMRLEEEYRKQKVQWGTGHELQPKLDLVFASKEEEGVVELVEAAAALPLMENLRSALHGLCLAMHRAQALHGRFACFRHCCDVSRLALVFETPRQLISAAKRLMEKREVLWLENEFANPSCDGCRQVSLGLRLAESQVTELRLLLRPLLAAKKLQRRRLEDALEAWLVACSKEGSEEVVGGQGGQSAQGNETSLHKEAMETTAPGHATSEEQAFQPISGVAEVLSGSKPGELAREPVEPASQHHSPEPLPTAKEKREIAVSTPTVAGVAADVGDSPQEISSTRGPQPQPTPKPALGPPVGPPPGSPEGPPLGPPPAAPKPAAATATAAHAQQQQLQRMPHQLWPRHSARQQQERLLKPPKKSQALVAPNHSQRPNLPLVHLLARHLVRLRGHLSIHHPQHRSLQQQQQLQPHAAPALAKTLSETAAGTTAEAPQEISSTGGPQSQPTPKPALGPPVGPPPGSPQGPPLDPPPAAPKPAAATATAAACHTSFGQDTQRGSSRNDC